MDVLIPWVTGIWHWGLFFLHIAVVGSAFVHLLLWQQNSRAAAFWAVIILFVPLLGGIFYGLFGINSLRRRGKDYREHQPEYKNRKLESVSHFSQWKVSKDQFALEGLGRTLEKISRFGFLVGNKVEVLENGDLAMTSMLNAIRQAEVSISICSYIFEAKGVGVKFVDELVRAKARGVEVRVLVDDAGTRYSFPPITRILRNQGVKAIRYMPLRFFIRILTMNLRNHRKIMVVDGKIGFTGGMNIRQGNMLKQNPTHPLHDMHFKLEGPIVCQLQQVFAEDWKFCAHETLQGETWFPPLEQVGNVAAIGIPDGPDEDKELMPRALYAAIHAAQKEIHIMTPYFLPEEALIWSLILAVQRGVEVSIITPRNNNIPFVRWAAWTIYDDLLLKDVRIYESAGHFDHSKFMTVDKYFSMIGSTNWDPRSLRLNFEFNVACFDEKLAKDLNYKFNEKLSQSNEITRDDLKRLPLWQQAINGFSRLFIPFL